MGNELTGAMTRASLLVSSGTAAGLQEEQRGLEDGSKFLVARRQAHVAETVELATAMVVAEEEEEGQSQARGVTGPE